MRTSRSAYRRALAGSGYRRPPGRRHALLLLALAALAAVFARNPNSGGARRKLPPTP